MYYSYHAKTFKNYKKNVNITHKLDYLERDPLVADRHCGDKMRTITHCYHCSTAYCLQTANSPLSNPYFEFGDSERGGRASRAHRFVWKTFSRCVSVALEENIVLHGLTAHRPRGNVYRKAWLKCLSDTMTKLDNYKVFGLKKRFKVVTLR